MDYDDARALVLDTLAGHLADLAADLLGPGSVQPPEDAAQRRADLSRTYDVDAVLARAFTSGTDGCYRLHPHVDADELARLAAQHRREVNPTVPSDLPCPHWCDQPHAHPFDRYALGVLRRDHVHRFSDSSICADVELRERATSPVSGVSDLRSDVGALLVRVHVSDGIGYLTGASARRLAAQLLDAADLHDAELARIGADDPLA